MHTKLISTLSAITALLTLSITASFANAQSPISEIRGGQDAKNKDFNAVGVITELVYDKERKRYVISPSFCTATLISPTQVLTAAHCAMNAKGTKLVDKPIQAVFLTTDSEFQNLHPWGFAAAAIGFTDLVTNASDLEDFGIHVRDIKPEDIHVHPDTKKALSKKQFDSQFHPDIAVLAFDKPLTAIPPARLANKAFFNALNPKNKLLATGFGDVTDGFLDGTLQKARLPRIPLSACEKEFNSKKPFNPSVLCFSNPVKSLCPGDSGGPLWATNKEGKKLIVGVASFIGSLDPNKPCSENTTISAFQKPTSMSAWFDSVANLDYSIR